jgi:hypothetical protein
MHGSSTVPLSIVIVGIQQTTMTSGNMRNKWHRTLPGRLLPDRYWNDLYEQQQVGAVGRKEKKARKPPKPNTLDPNKAKESEV